MKLNLESPIFSIISAGPDGTPRRTIEGVAVEWNTISTVSGGQQVKFLPGSLPTDGPAPKFMLDHSAEKPLGMVTERVDTGEAMLFAAKVGPGQIRDEVLAMAGPGEYYDSVSVGVQPIDYTFEENVMVVKSGRWMELSLLPFGAFANAKVAQVAASEPEPETPQTDTSEEETMSEPTPEIVEATSQVPTSLFFTAPRSPIKTNGDYLHHTIQAKLNPGSESAQWVAAADEAKAKHMLNAADDSFSNNPAFSPVQYDRNVVQVNIGARPVIDACGGTRAIPASGMTISIPKITVNGTVATTSEGGTPSSTGIESAYVNGTVVKLAGTQKWSVELQERSDPSFAQIMLDNMTRSYRKATEVATIAAITAGGTQATATAASAAGIQSFVSTESAAAYLATGDVVSAYTAGVSQWSLMQNAVDGSNRPLFSAGQPQNSAGSAEATTLFGNVLGVPLYVSSNMVSTSIDESAFLIVPSAIELFESSQLMLSVNVPSTGEIEAMIYGYFCPIVTIAGGLRRFNLT
jgi:hypothetical protein